ncbi:hypothetical protein GCM10023336_28960 [Streptomyces similanensis]|uniref:Uncharacterized protein n=1 Tax=Streptomyces similanensis TaxID=1274988 RepID=A0ABP9KHS8_9ACTN
MIADRPVRPAATLGVGSNCTTADGSAKSPLLPRWFGPPFSPSDARGVGSRDTAVRRSGPPSPCAPAPFVSEVRGVGSNATVSGSPSPLRVLPLPSRARGVGSCGEDEQAAPLVGSADLVRAYNAPLRIEPEVGKVAEDSVEADSKVVRDVLKERDSGSKNPKGTGNVRPEVSLIVSSFQLAGEAERLARVAADQDIDGLHGGPVDGGQVAEVGGVGVVVGEDARRAGVGVGHPREGPAEHLLYGHVQPAVSGAQGPDAGAVLDGELPGDRFGGRPVDEGPQVERCGGHAASAFWVWVRAWQAAQ